MNLSLRTSPGACAGALCIFSYFYNKRPGDIVRAVFGNDIHPNYLREKVEVLVESPWRFIGMLDDLHQGKLIEAALQAEGQWAMGQSVRVLAALQAAAEPPPTGTPGTG